MIAFLFAYAEVVQAQSAAMFRGDTQHSGIYDSTSVTSFTRVKWKFKTGDKIFSSPAVWDGTVYFGSNDHFLYAVSLDGKLKWKFETKARVASSPAISDGIVYFASYDGLFYALDAASGQLRWKFQTAGERRFTAKHIHGIDPQGETMPDPFDFYLSSPAVWQRVVYFGSGDGNIYALDAQSGTLKWKFHTGDVVHASPAIANGILYIGSWDTFFYALDAVTGKEKWRFKTGEDHDIHNQEGLQASALVADGVVYFGCRDSNFYALDANSGEKKWVFNNKGSWVINTPVLHQGKIYFSTSDSGLFHALDAKTGVESYTLKFTWPMFSSPAVAGNMLYVGTHEGKLIAIDMAAQKKAWDFQTDGSREYGPKYTKPDGSPNYGAAMADGFYDNIVSGISAMQAMGSVLSSPVVSDGVIYFGSTDGNLYAIE